MPAGLLKYFNNRVAAKAGGGENTADTHAGPLSWPGTELGFPVRGHVPLMKQHELSQLVHVCDYHSRLFRLWEPEDKALFDEIQDRIANGWYFEKRRKDTEVAEHLEPAVWLEWVQIYGEIPNSQFAGGAHAPYSPARG